MLYHHYYLRGRNHGENLGATVPIVGRICPTPPGRNRVKAAENLGVIVT